MHLPDPSVISFSAAVISLATAITGVVRLILDKKSKSVAVQVLKKSESRRRTVENSFFKKLLSVPRGMAKLFKKKENHWTTGSFALGTAITALNDVDVVLNCVDNDHIDPSNLNRYFR